MMNNWKRTAAVSGVAPGNASMNRGSVDLNSEFSL